MEMDMLNFAVVVEESGTGKFFAWCPAFDCFASEAGSFDEALNLLREDLERFIMGHPDIRPGEC